MSEQILRIALVYIVGAAVLAADFFVPSHFLLSALGLGLFGYGLYQVFMIDATAGMVNAALLVVAIPAGFVVAIRNWHRTPIGRRISPPNPTLTAADRMPVGDMEALVGQTGRTSTMLRPVGMCEFAGRRVECKTETGVIAAGVEVEAVRVVDRTVVVQPVRVEQEQA